MRFQKVRESDESQTTAKTADVVTFVQVVDSVQTEGNTVKCDSEGGQQVPHSAPLKQLSLRRVWACNKTISSMWTMFRASAFEWVFKSLIQAGITWAQSEGQSRRTQR